MGSNNYKETIKGLLDEMFQRGIIVSNTRNRLLVKIIITALGFLAELREDDSRE